MNGFLKCYYGYKNRGDELLFFGVVDYIYANFSIDKLYVEVGDSKFFAKWLAMHSDICPHYSKIILVDKKNLNRYILNDTLKFFGGGEVITDEISLSDDKYMYKYTQKEEKQTKDEVIDVAGLASNDSPSTITHYWSKFKETTMYTILSAIGLGSKKAFSSLFARAGRNYLILYPNDILSGNVVFLGGFSKPHLLTTRLLYKIALQNAQTVVCRDQTSYELVLSYRNEAVLHRDFGLDTLSIIEKAYNTDIKKNKDNTQKKDTDTSDIDNVDTKNTPVYVSVYNLEGLTEETVATTMIGKYLLINIHPKQWNELVKQRIVEFCQQYPDCSIVCMPGDVSYDVGVLEKMAHILQGLERKVYFFDWTQYHCTITCQLIQLAVAGIGSRLHVLLLLQHYKVPCMPIVYAEKISKLIQFKKNVCYVDYDSIYKAYDKRIDRKKFASYMRVRYGITSLQIILSKKVGSQVKRNLIARGYHSIDVIPGQKLTQFAISLIDDIEVQKVDKIFLCTCDSGFQLVINKILKISIPIHVFTSQNTSLEVPSKNMSLIDKLFPYIAK